MGAEVKVQQINILYMMCTLTRDAKHTHTYINEWCAHVWVRGLEVRPIRKWCRYFTYHGGASGHGLKSLILVTDSRVTRMSHTQQRHNISTKIILYYPSTYVGAIISGAADDLEACASFKV